MGDVSIYFNPGCTKCRTAWSILEDLGADAEQYRYLDERPTRDDLEHLLVMLGTDDPRAMVRTGEAVYDDLGLAGAGRDELLDAMAAHPILIERPIVIRGDRAVVARPPERLRDLFS